MTTLFWVAITVIVSLPILATINLWRVWRKTTSQSKPQGKVPPDKSWTDKIHDRWNKWKALLLISLGFFALHLCIWMNFPVFWGEWYTQRWFGCFQVILVLALFLTSRKEKGVKPLGLLVLVFALLGVGRTVWNTVETADVANRVIASRERITPYVVEKELLPHNKQNEEYVRKYLAERLPPRDAEAMTLIIKRESGFNQYEKDGKSPYRRRPTPDNAATHYVGLAQIDEHAHLKNAQKLGMNQFNFYERDGNLNYTVWLFKKEGFRPWGATVDKLDSPDNKPSSRQQEVLVSKRPSKVVTAPTDGWSELVPLEPNGNNTSCIIENDADVRIRINGKKIYKYVPGTRLVIDEQVIFSEEFQSIGEKPGTAPCSYK